MNRTRTPLPRLSSVLALSAVALLAVSTSAGAATHVTSTGRAANPQGAVTQSQVKVAKTAATITRSQVSSRAQGWVSQNVPYNQGASLAANSAPTGPYRTDCSGFVSMAWGLGSSLTTQTLPSVSTQIPASQLKTGDVLDYNSSTNPTNGSHVVMFVNWADASHTSYVGMEEAGSMGAVARTITFPYDGNMSGGTWIPYRYNNIVDDTATSTGQSVVSSSDDGTSVFFSDKSGHIINDYVSGGQWLQRTLPGTTYGPVIPRADGNQVFFADPSGQVFSTFLSGTSWILAPLPGSAAGAVTPRADGRQVFFADKATGTVRSDFINASTWIQATLPGSASGPVTPRPDGAQVFFADKATGAVRSDFVSGGTWALGNLPGSASGAVTPRGDGRQVFFADKATGAVKSDFILNGTWVLGNLPGSTNGSVIPRADGAQVYFSDKSTSTVKSAFVSGGTWVLASLPGTASGAVTPRADGAQVFFAAPTSGQVQSDFISGGWTGPVALGGATNG